MTLLYESTVDELLTHLGRNASREDVLRVDPDKSGALLIQVQRAQGLVWYRCAQDKQIERLELAADKKLPGGPHFSNLLKLGSATLLGWRPGKRATLLLKDDAGERILKAYRRGRSVDANCRYGLAQQAAAGSCLQVPRPLGHDQETEQIEMSVVPGEPLSLQLSEADQFFRLGHGLRHLQAGAPHSSLARHDRDAELTLLEDLSQRVLALRTTLPLGWSEAILRLKQKLPRSRSEGLVLTHRDLHDGQILVMDGSIGLLDFDLLCLGDPALDVANLTAHLRLRAIQELPGTSEQVAEQLGLSLLDGLDRASDDGFLENLRFYQATSFLRLALVYYLRPRWTDVCPPLVSLASRCIHEMATS
ncbi:MAG: hypothetical protein ACI9F9_002854 [Candidatus Paceibacteria bacterium]|jgi:hypothetical protein